MNIPYEADMCIGVLALLAFIFALVLILFHGKPFDKKYQGDDWRYDRDIAKERAMNETRKRDAAGETRGNL